MSDIGAKTVALIKENAEYQEASLKPSKEIMKVWKKVHAEMRSEFGEAVFRSWLKPLSLQAFYHGTMEVSVPTRFMRDWIQNHYLDQILRMLKTENAEIARLQFVVSVQNQIQTPETDHLSANGFSASLASRSPERSSSVHRV